MIETKRDAPGGFQPGKFSSQARAADYFLVYIYTIPPRFAAAR